MGGLTALDTFIWRADTFIDKVLAEHYGFTEEELDYIINYDIKYRMGKDLQEGH